MLLRVNITGIIDHFKVAVGQLSAFSHVGASRPDRDVASQAQAWRLLRTLGR